jgi:hypothetical protein
MTQATARERQKDSIRSTRTLDGAVSTAGRNAHRAGHAARPSALGVSLSRGLSAVCGACAGGSFASIRQPLNGRHLMDDTFKYASFTVIVINRGFSSVGRA